MLVRLVFFLLIFVATSGEAVERFASPTGTGTTCSQAVPCSNRTAITASFAGDIVTLASGTLNSPLVYRGSDYMINLGDWIPGRNGTSTAPITIRAAVDGGLIIDGEHARSPVSIRNSWVVLEGINAKRAGPTAASVINVGGGATNVTIRRVVAWDSMVNRNNGVWGIHGATNVLLEDVAGFGPGRGIISPSQGGNRVTVRRGWFRWEGSTYASFATSKYRYNSTNPLWENVLLTWDELSMPQNFCVTDTSGICTNIFKSNFEPHIPQAYIIHDAWSGNKCSGGSFTTPGQQLYGSIFYATASQKISFPSGLRFGGAGSSGAESQDTGCVDVKDVVIAIHPSNASFASTRSFFFSSLGTCCNIDSSFPGNPTASNQFYAQPFKGRIRNITSIAGNGTSISTSKWDINLTNDLAHGTSLSQVPSPWTNTGTQGANACYRYVNGVKTNTPLWPWVMNERIKVATGMAGNYFDSGATTVGCGPTQAQCSGILGQTRTAVDVTAQIESVLGPIPDTCRQTATTPPPPPAVEIDVQVHARPPVTARPPATARPKVAE